MYFSDDKEQKNVLILSSYANENTILSGFESIPVKGTDSNKFYDTLRIPVFNSDGTRRALVLFGLDITEHKHNKEKEKLIQEILVLPL